MSSHCRDPSLKVSSTQTCASTNEKFSSCFLSGVDNLVNGDASLAECGDQCFISDVTAQHERCTRIRDAPVQPPSVGSTIKSITPAATHHRVSDVQGIAKAFVELGTKHYPERMQKFWIVGAPAIFSVLWNAVVPFIDEVTKSKIVMLPYGPALPT